MTVAPSALAIWTAAVPTAELPPFMKIVWPASSCATLTRAVYDERAQAVMPAASIGETFSGRRTRSDAGTRTYWDREPWSDFAIVDWVVRGW